MKMKSLIGIVPIMILALLCIGCVCATEDGDNMSSTDDTPQLEANDAPDDLNGNSSGETGFTDANATTST